MITVQRVPLIIYCVLFIIWIWYIQAEISNLDKAFKVILSTVESLHNAMGELEKMVEAVSKVVFDSDENQTDNKESESEVEREDERQLGMGDNHTT
jgi:hypothetical protein